jgi:hypothetical protein
MTAETSKKHKISGAARAATEVDCSLLLQGPREQFRVQLESALVEQMDADARLFGWSSANFIAAQIVRDFYTAWRAGQIAAMEARQRAVADLAVSR